MIQFFQDFYQYEFLQRATLTAIVVGILCGVVGSFIVLRGLALMGDAISHAVLPGVAVSYMLSINFFYGAMAAGLLTAIGIGFISQNSRVKTDSSIGIVFSAAFALGIILTVKAQTAKNLESILFGNVLAVQPVDMWITIIVGAIIILTVFLFYKELLVSSFDPTMAAAYGLNTKMIHYLIMVLLTLATVSSIKTVGVILVVSMLITPASTAYLLTNRLSTMVFLAGFIGAIASVVGIYLSFLYDLPTGPVIALTATAFFVVAFIFAPKQGVLWRTLKTRKQRSLIN